jgi:hypothetical protein
MVDEPADKLIEWLGRSEVSVNDFPLSLTSFGSAGRGFIAARDIAVNGNENK